jgi:hypothetical protein
MPDWPWNESRLERRTRIAHLYRDALFEAAPHLCYELDATLDTYGQHWITGTKPPINPDEPMTVKQIAEWTDVRVQAVYNRITALNIRPVGTNRYRKTYNLADFNHKQITSV